MSTVPIDDQLKASLALEQRTQGRMVPQFDPSTPMGLIAMAASQGASVEQMQQLFELKLRVEADEAKKAFNKAFSAFKSEAVRVVKNVAVNDGPLKGKRYADLFGVVSAVTPVLSKHDLSHSWKLTKDELSWMEVTCTISHALGHSEAVSMGAAPDAGPGRNAIQARGSAKSYLERYTLLAATGLAAADSDNDGNGSGVSMPQEDYAYHEEQLQAAATMPELQKIFAVAFKASKAANDSSAQSNLTKLYEQRKKALR